MYVYLYIQLAIQQCLYQCFIQAYTSKTSLSIVSQPPYSPLHTLHFTARSLCPPYFFTTLHTTLGEKGPRKLQILFELKGKWQIVFAFFDAFLCNDFTIISLMKTLFNMLYKIRKVYKIKILTCVARPSKYKLTDGPDYCPWSGWVKFSKVQEGSRPCCYHHHFTYGEKRERRRDISYDRFLCNPAPLPFPPSLSLSLDMQYIQKDTFFGGKFTSFLKMTGKSATN